MVRRGYCHHESRNGTVYLTLGAVIDSRKFHRCSMFSQIILIIILEIDASTLIVKLFRYSERVSFLHIGGDK